MVYSSIQYLKIQTNAHFKIKKLLKSAEEVIEDYNLIYVRDKNFPIIRKKWE